jgi:hypothetical protein
MELKNQFREAFASGRDRLERSAVKSPFWERIIFAAIIIAAGGGTENWLKHNTALALSWRYLIAIAIASLLGILVSILLDKLHTMHR